MSLLVSAQSLVWIAIDRFVAAVFPMKLGLISSKIQTIAIVSTWICAGFANFQSLIRCTFKSCCTRQWHSLCRDKYRIISLWHATKKQRQAIKMAVTILLLFYRWVTSHTLVYFIPYWRPSCAIQRVLYFILLYGSLSQGLGTTKFTNLIGWIGYWPRSRFSHLDRHLDR